MPMRKSTVELIGEGRVRKMTLLRDDPRLNYACVINGWPNSNKFRKVYFALLLDAPFKAMF
jgi:hypothetical protein